MIDIEFPDIHLRDGSLELIAQTTKSVGSLPSGKLDNWVALGEPITRLIDVAYVATDKDLVQYINASPDQIFYLVQIAASFRPLDGESFVGAWVKLKLTSAPDEREDSKLLAPIAWSLEPQRIESHIEITKTIKLGASLKLFPGIEAGPEISKAKTEIFTEPFLLALNELRWDPAWEFRRTAIEQIRGSYRLSLVVRKPVGSVGMGSVSLEATVERKHFGIFPYRGMFDDNPTIDFTLG